MRITRNSLLPPVLMVCCWCQLVAGQGGDPSQSEAVRAANTIDARLAAELPRVPARSPAEAENAFHLLDGFRLELVAAEPLVTDPVAVKYDENGLAYIAEMGDYPYSDKSHDKSYADQTSLPLGRVRVLEDTDGDGRYDKSTILADKLSWPTGLALWKGGVFVTCTPDIIYLKDTNGDRIADVRRVVFTGFRKFNVQSVINNLQWGLDHFIYGAGSSNGGEIRSVADVVAKPVTMRRSDFRFAPGAESIELVTGGARFGNTFDDWGNRFVCDIRNPVQHIVLENRYLARNPSLSVRSALHDSGRSGGEVAIFRASPPEPWRVINSERLASDPNSTSPNSEKVASGFLTSSSGITVYRGAAYPRAYYGNIFVGDVAGNVALRYVMEVEGPTFKATRVHADYEFLASTDNWFRPVNFINAPDGTLHIVDMYRETIEHPWSIPDDIKSHLDLVSGRDRGRIYRLVPPRYRAGFEKPKQPRLGSAVTAELVAELENPNSWWRDTAHRLLFERQDLTAVPALRRLLLESKHPAARLHALWSLSGLASLTEQDVTLALADRSPHVRRHALRLTETMLADSTKLMGAVFRAADDVDPRVRFQAALTLGEVDDPRAGSALIAIAQRDGADEWMRAAVLSSLSNSNASFLVNVLSDHEFSSSVPGQAMIDQLAFTVGTSEPTTEVANVLAVLAGGGIDDLSADDLEVQTRALIRIGAGLKQSGRNLSQFAAAVDRPTLRMIDKLLADARGVVLDVGSTVGRREEAIERVGYGSFEVARQTLSPLLGARQPAKIQSAAIDAIAGYRQSQVADALLEKYPELTPRLRKQVVQALLARSNRLPKLVEAVAGQKVSAALISTSQRRRILDSRDKAMVQIASTVFASDVPSPRKEVIGRYQVSLSLTPNLTNGETVFRRECLNCHRLGEEGHEVGPNLSTVRHRTTSDVMLQIVDPNRDVSPDYLEYSVVTLDGRVATGTIAAETATGITLRAAETKEQTILRRDIDAITTTGKSLMPEGLEQKITPQEMADLLAFVLHFERS